MEMLGARKEGIMELSSAGRFDQGYARSWKRRLRTCQERSGRRDQMRRQEIEEVTKEMSGEHIAMIITKI
jgi:hypothetical protein